MRAKFRILRPVGGRGITLAFCVCAIAVMAVMALAACTTSKNDKPKERIVGPCHTDVADSEHSGAGAEHTAPAYTATENCEVDRIRDDQERKRMEEFVASHVPASTILTSLRLKSGETIDCVDVSKQPALRRKGMEGHQLQMRPEIEIEKLERDAPQDQQKSAAAASTESGDPGRDGVELVKQEYGSETPLCPDKSVPIRHITMDTLRHFETLRDYFRKGAPHLMDGPTDEHQYAHAYRTVDNWGAQSILNVWAPYTHRDSEFSLSQIWVVRGSGANRETVETGWQKYRDLYGDYRPRLFIYFTPDNYGDGGCYNLDCDAFVQVNNSIYIGGGFTNVSAHPHPSTAWTITLRWQKDGTNGHWWLKYGDTWVGYYPRSLFDGNGLRDMAAKVDFGGEIIDDQTGGNHTRTDMGSGHFPGDGFGYAAYHRQIRYITTANVWGTYPSLTDSRTDSDCYDIKVNSSSGSWERYFYFGGPGFGSHCQ